MDTCAAKESACGFAEDRGGDGAECLRTRHIKDLIADELGGGFDRAVIVLCPRQPRQEMIITAFMNSVEKFLSVSELEAPDYEPLGFEVAFQWRRRGPVEASGGEVVF